MSLLLALASMYMAGKVVAEAGRDVTKIPARSKIQEQSKNGSMDVVDCFEDILKICDVKRKKHGNSTVSALVDYDEVKEKVDKICNRTFFGDFVINEPKIILNGSGNSFTEIYALKIPCAMKFNLKKYYMACAEHTGHIY